MQKTPYPPPPVAPMRGVAVQAKGVSARIVPPPPLAPMRGVRAVQAKSVSSGIVPPPPYAPSRQRASMAPAAATSSCVQRSVALVTVPTVLNEDELLKSVKAEYDKFIALSDSDSTLFYGTGHNGPRQNGVDPDFVAANATVKTVFAAVQNLPKIASANRSKSNSDKVGLGSADIILSRVAGFKTPKMVYHIKLQDDWKI